MTHLRLAGPTAAASHRTARGAPAIVLRLSGAMALALAVVLSMAVPGLAATTGPRQISAQVSLLDLDDQDSIQTLSVTVTNSSREPMTGTSIALKGPAGWTTSPERIALDAVIAPGEGVTSTFDVRVPTLRAGFRSYVFTADITYGGGDGQGALTGQRVLTSGEPLASFAAARNNVGTTTLAERAAGDFDGARNSFSDEALGRAGVIRGGTLTGAGATFTWPDLGPTEKDNVRAEGQAFAFSGTGSSLALLVSGSSQSASGTVTVFYTDGTTSSATVTVPNWTGTPPAGVQIVAEASGRNTPGGFANQQSTYRLFAIGIPLDAGKRVKVVQLPANAGILVFDVQAVR